MSDPIARLEFCRAEIDRVFGQNYAADHPDVVAAVMASAASDWAASRIAVAIEGVAVALAEDASEQRRGLSFARALVRP
jgi:hypothetical protein